VLVQCAWAATREKDSYYKAQFARLRARSGAKQAICAVAASILTAIYHTLKRGTVHSDLGAQYFDRKPTEAKLKNLIGKLANLGYHAEIRPIQNAA
jgi:predicted RNase H-related nuclease YkuK (DUF458 family)